jgi:hypothetical protein
MVTSYNWRDDFLAAVSETVVTTGVDDELRGAILNGVRQAC